MPVYKDNQRNTWYVKCYYTDFTGSKKQKLKRGFKLQREAKDWENDFITRLSAQPSMPFKILSELYLADKKAHTKQITYETKKNRLDKWILPYFNHQPINAITAPDIRNWQAALKESKNANNQPLSEGYLQNIVMEASSVFNYAVRFYGLSVNPFHIAGNTVGKKKRSLTFWTREEFDTFISTFDNSSQYHLVFLMLYYTGMRIGELEALTFEDIDLKDNVIHINKTYHLINGKDVITPPKTKKAVRDIVIPKFLVEAIKSYKKHLYDPIPESRVFMSSHSTYARQMQDHMFQSSVKRIRLHDLRHSHASLLIEMGFSALLVSERLGHENVSTTLDIYSHLFPSKQIEVAQRLDKLCENNSYF